jgi:ABC-type multidrug transport system fused ATPase/permease subunit
VLVLDECTASVDHETDALIQDTVRTQLAGSTVICIAHRLHTIAYYDLVLVMDRGEVAELGDPFTLMSRNTSQFHAMCVASGDYSELFLTAKAAYDQRQQEIKEKD